MKIQGLDDRHITILALIAALLLASCTQSNVLPTTLPEVTSSENVNQQTSASPTTLPGNFRFDRITSSDGLSHPYVRGITRDQLGFMWFATTNGLNLYDGYTFTIFRNKPGDKATLDFDDLRVVYEDTDHVIWVGGAGGVDRFDRTTGKFSRLDEYGQVFCMLESQDGLLWVGFWHGLYAYDRNTGNKRYSFSSKLSSDVDPENNLQGYVRAIGEDVQGNLWLGTDYGLYRLDRETNNFYRYAYDPDKLTNLGTNRVHSVFIDPYGNIWAGTEGGLYRFDRETKGFSHDAFNSNDTDGYSNDTITAILEDESGSMWIGTENGLIYFNPTTNQFTRFLHDPYNQASLGDNIIFSLFADPTGLVWVGTGNGISLFNPRANQFKVIHSINRLTNKESVQAVDTASKDFSELGVEAILEDQQGYLWLGTMKGGVFRIDPDSGEIKNYQVDSEEPGNLGDDRVSAIYQDHNGTVWIGTGNGWLANYDPVADEFVPVENVSVQIVSLNEDQVGNLWIGTRSKGVFSLNISQGVLTNYPYVDPAQSSGPTVFSSHIVTSIFIDQAGNPWIGTYLGGINLWTGDRITHYRHDPYDQNSLSHNYVLSFYEEMRGDDRVMWIGTMGGGLNRFDLDSQTFTRYRKQDGLADDIVTCILGDEAGNLWMSTSEGLSRFDPEQKIFWNFSERYGIPSGSVQPGGCLKRADGTMLFTTPTSVIAFDPMLVQVNQHIPPLVITTLLVNGQPIGEDITSDLDLHLASQENNLALEFAALDYASPDENTYAYRMEGADNEWMFADTSHRVDYLNINPGNYTFQVRGSNSDGVWNEQGLSVNISISPPFWTTGWFLGLAGLALLVGGYSAYRIRMQRIELQQRELENQIKERTEEINQRRNEIEALYQADENLYQNLDMEQVLQVLIDTAVRLLNADKGSVMCWDEARENLVIRAVLNFQSQTILNARIPRGQGIAGVVAEKGTITVVEDTLQEPNVTQAIVKPENIRAFVQLPIKIDDEVFGVFSVDYTSPRTFDREEIRLMLALAQRAAIAIQNAQLYEEAQELAATRERSRLARDLHDAVTQTLFSASLIAEALPALWERSPEKGRDRLSKLRQLNRGALAEMRTLLLELRPAALMETSLSDLVRQLAESATGRTGIPVKTHIEGVCQLTAEVHLSVYRIIQEALNNAVKHANASHIEIELICTSQQDGKAESLKLTILDDGRGFDPQITAPEKLGLNIMRERAQSIGAELILESQLGKGTHVFLSWQAVN